MRRSSWCGLWLLLAACEARISGTPGDRALVDAAPGDDAAAIDAATDAATFASWSPPTKIGIASSTMLDEDDVTLSSNALELIFAIDSATNGKDLYYSSRTSTAAPWSAAVKLPFNSATFSDETPRFTADDKTLYFASDRASKGNLDIYSVTHANPDATSWGSPQALGTLVNTTQTEKWFMPCGNTNHYIVARGTAANGTDLYEGTLGSAPTAVAELNSVQNETGTFLSQDCLTIYFASTRPTSTSPSMIYRSTRTSLTSPWQAPTPVTDFPIAGSTAGEEDPWLSPDGHTFVFASNAAGTKDLYISTR